MENYVWYYKKEFLNISNFTLKDKILALFLFIYLCTNVCFSEMYFTKQKDWCLPRMVPISISMKMNINLKMKFHVGKKNSACHGLFKI